ncbi:MAG: hypothetical protein II371_05530, partial [Flavobacteriales bacterium]|nr:hypothetical protein [Flavobacteriales bacterium]
LVVQHMEPDHSANIDNFLKVYPDAVVPMFMEYPFMFKFHDGQYIISAMSVFDGLFDKDGNARVYKTPESPGYQRSLKEAYSKLTPTSNPVLFIYKFKDVE